MTRQPMDRAEVLILLARAHNQVALTSTAVLERDAVKVAAENAARRAQLAMRDARTAGTERRAIVELALADVWLDGTLGPVEALDLLRDTDPTSTAVTKAFSAFVKRADLFDEVRSTGGNEVRRLRGLVETFAAAAVDAFLGEKSVEDGFSDRHEKVLRVFQRNENGLLCSMGSKAIRNKCRAAGLDHRSANIALRELAAAGVLEQMPGDGGMGPRYIPSELGRQVIPRLRLPGRKRQAPALA